jgi:hypothetical protein
MNKDFDYLTKDETQRLFAVIPTERGNENTKARKHEKKKAVKARKRLELPA